MSLESSSFEAPFRWVWKGGLERDTRSGLFEDWRSFVVVSLAEVPGAEASSCLTSRDKPF